MSPPSRRRGLKSGISVGIDAVLVVASFAEAWIEMVILLIINLQFFVASFAEAWIEISYVKKYMNVGLRRLLRGGVD